MFKLIAKCTISAKPYPLSTPTNQTQFPRLGTKVMIEVKVTGCPTPSFSWLYNNTSSVAHEDVGVSSLVDIEDIVVADFGQYSVVASNPSGNYTTAFQLIPQGMDMISSKFVFIYVIYIKIDKQLETIVASSIRLNMELINYTKFSKSDKEIL